MSNHEGTQTPQYGELARSIGAHLVAPAVTLVNLANLYSNSVLSLLGAFDGLRGDPVNQVHTTAEKVVAHVASLATGGLLGLPGHLADVYEAARTGERQRLTIE